MIVYIYFNMPKLIIILKKFSDFFEIFFEKKKIPQTGKFENETRNPDFKISNPEPVPANFQTQSRADHKFL